MFYLNININVTFFVYTMSLICYFILFQFEIIDKNCFFKIIFIKCDFPPAHFKKGFGENIEFPYKFLSITNSPFSFSSLLL